MIDIFFWALSHTDSNLLINLSSSFPNVGIWLPTILYYAIPDTFFLLFAYFFPNKAAIKWENALP